MKDLPFLSWIELSPGNLRHNVRSLQKLAGQAAVAVCVKANAYGHGLPEVVRVLQEQAEVEYITVHALPEAILAREVGWTRKILLLGPLAKSEIDGVLEYDLEPTIFDLKTLSAVGRLATNQNKKIRTHMKLETGTNRQGITVDELPAFARVYQGNPFLGGPYGASMHFADVEDTIHHSYSTRQLKQFRGMVRLMHALGIPPKIKHAASSAAMILFENTRLDMVRPGIAVYGHWPSKETYLSYRLGGGQNDLFSPILSWKTRVTQIKKIPADSFVGYGCTYRTTSPTKLAIIPVGYADGYARALSNLAHVLIRGRRAPVRGRVCMNLTMVDVTDVKGARQGDTVTLIGSDGDQVITAEKLAAWSGSINYEILARLSPLLPRVVR
ncbi:MAG: alanine racemase [bacterium]